MTSYGLGWTGTPGLWMGQSTSECHAVMLPWPTDAVVGRAECGCSAVLCWVAGWPLAFSLQDGRVCPICVEVVTGRAPTRAPSGGSSR